MTTFKFHNTNIVDVHRGDPMFVLSDGIAIADRASIQISENCPDRYRNIIQDCFERGWIEPLARMYDHEATFDTLKNNE